MTAPGPSVDGFSGRQQPRERASDGCGFIQAPGDAHALSFLKPGFRAPLPPGPCAVVALGPLWSNLG